MGTVTGMWSLARSGARAHRGSLAGSALAVALAAALIACSGVLLQTGSGGGDELGLLSAVAGSFAATVAILAVLVVSSTLSLALRARQRDFALLRAVGATKRQLRHLVVLETLLVTIIAAPLGAIPGMAATSALTPLLRSADLIPPDGDLTVGPLPVVAAMLIMLPLAGVSALLASRETVRASPAETVRQSVVEAPTSSTGRRLSAVVLAGLGLASALSPLVVPGTLGSAGASTSAFVLVGAAALAGPVLLRRIFGGHIRFRGSVRRLAMGNLKGSAGRLTVAVVPLALALTAGTAQSTLDATISQAARTQLAQGLHGTLVLPTPSGDGGPVAAITSAATLGSLPVRVRTDPEDVPGLEGLSWEATSLRVLGGHADPQVVEGSIEGLSSPDTVAVSEDVAFEVGGLGSRLEMREGGREFTVTVVAVVARGLGFGDYITGPATVAEQGLEPHTDAVLLPVDDARAAQFREAGAVSPETYASGAVVDDGAQRLSLVLLLALLTSSSSRPATHCSW